MESTMKMGTSYFQVAVVCFGLVLVLAVFIVYNVVYNKQKRPDEMDSFVGGANNAGSGGSSITGPAPMAGATPLNPNLFDKGVPYATGTNAGSNASSNLPTGITMGISEPFTPSTEGFENPSDPNQRWAKANPQGAGDLAGKNFLNAGALIGVNTVGQSLRNGSWDVRSEPANPQVAISPWFNSTIEPDVNRRPLEGK